MQKCVLSSLRARDPGRLTPLAAPCRKLGEWDDGDGFGPSITEEEKATALNKHERVVVLKRMFTLQELVEYKSLLLDLKNDVRDECSTLGEVTNVVLYDVRTLHLSRMFSIHSITSQAEADGVMTVKFKDPLSAQACVIVSPSLHASVPNAANLGTALENEWPFLRRSSYRSVPLRRQAALQTERIQ